MSNDGSQPLLFRPWDGSVDLTVDRAIMDTRIFGYPLYGLDPHDPRD